MAITLNGSTGITTPGVTNSGAETIATTLAVTGATTLTGDVTLGSSLLATPSGSAPSYTCRAWVNFNGQGTVAIRASGNVSSVTDNGVGQYTINFATAMPDANYAVTFSCANVATNVDTATNIYNFSTTSFSYQHVEGTTIDAAQNSIAVFR